MAVQLLVLIALAGLVTPMAVSRRRPFKGVWRVVERTIPASTADRRDPFGAFSEGTHTNLQPELMIFTAKHYSRTTDTAAQPRPTTGYAEVGFAPPGPARRAAQRAANLTMRNR